MAIDLVIPFHLYPSKPPHVGGFFLMACVFSCFLVTRIMKMRIGFSAAGIRLCSSLVFLISLSSGSILAQGLGAVESRLEMEPLDRAYEVVFDFVLVNRGTNRDVVLRVSAASNIRAEALQRTVLPGDSTRLVVTFVPNRPGKFSEVVRVFTALRAEPLMLEVSGRVNQPDAHALQACHPSHAAASRKKGVGVSEWSVEIWDEQARLPIPGAVLEVIKGGKVLWKGPTDAVGRLDLPRPLGLLVLRARSPGYSTYQSQEVITTASGDWRIFLVPTGFRADSVVLRKPPEPVVGVTEQPVSDNPLPEPEELGLPLSRCKTNHLIFLLDASASMRYEEKFRLGLAAIRDLQPYLRASDRMSLMVYAGEPRILGESLPAAVLPNLLQGLDTLRPAGQTAGNKAIREAVALARRNWIDGGNNQLVLITDGAFALGRNEQALFDRSGQGSGLFCSVVATKPDRADVAALDGLAEAGKGNLMVVRSLTDAEGMLLLEVKKQSSRRGLWKTGE
jgi:hypothetical protein